MWYPRVSHLSDPNEHVGVSCCIVKVLVHYHELLGHAMNELSNLLSLYEGWGVC